MSAGAEDPPPPGITGRAAELSALRGLLARTPLVTVTGPANVGKSTLARAALEAAARDGGHLGGGFVRVGCREEVDETGVAAALNRAAGLPPGTPPEALAAHCARQGLTVLLDDCDPMAGACAWLVRQLLRTGPGGGRGATTRPGPSAQAGTQAGPRVGPRAGPRAGLRIVATARRPLGLGAERVFAVRRLPVVPLLGAPLPMAPWLVAPLPVAPFLEASGGGPPCDAVGEPCDPADRLVWARLSVLPGDFDGWLAGCVGSSSDVPAQEVEAALERLSRAAVLARVRPEPGIGPSPTSDSGPSPAPGSGPSSAPGSGPGSAPGAAAPFASAAPSPSASARPLSTPRYRLSAAARAVGLARVRAAGEEATTLRAFRMACAALAAEAQVAWQGPDRRVAVRLVEAERHNLHAALTRPPQDADDALTALDIAVSLWFRWAVCGRRREGRAHLARLLRRSRDDTAVRARALWLAGWLAAQDHAHRTAEALLDRAGRAAARHADPDTLARVAHARGVLALRRADTRTAVACLRRAAGHAWQDAWYGPGPAHSQVLLAIALAAPGPASGPAPGPAAAAAGATTRGCGTVAASAAQATSAVQTTSAAQTASAVQSETRSGPLPGARCGHHVT
ncbi:hypothetical protein A6A06_12060 [Streptomyces sp. CB02923]|uniref:AAA family ATPase n=1 Tax=Streptomyces sp. CB02923 TaxID=1718985 RepID=UPI00093D2DF2|nr:AAA family ATPase [Streptomyces sp. CB02923]OKI01871.1 hypothetical protein A6A06_12060 [Streptomyces sp. CB02923]